MSGTTASAIARPKLVTRQQVAERTFAFHFEKPPNWTFKAGQALDLTLSILPRRMPREIRRRFESPAVPTKKP